jgi:hypothetical protein
LAQAQVSIDIASFLGVTYAAHISRRIFHQAFRPDAAVTYRPMQLRKAHQLLLELLHDPVNYELHVETHASSIIMSAVYDYETKPNDPLVSMIQGAMNSIVHAETPGKAAIIDAYPVCR